MLNICLLIYFFPFILLCYGNNFAYYKGEKSIELEVLGIVGGDERIMLKV